MNVHTKRILMLVGMGLFMAVQPIGGPAHLTQKWELLKAGHLYHVMDWLDLLLHSGMLIFATVYILWLLLKKVRGQNL